MNEHLVLDAKNAVADSHDLCVCGATDTTLSKLASRERKSGIERDALHALSTSFFAW